MPTPRKELDVDRYQELKRQGLAQDAIARQLGMAQSTLSAKVRMLEKTQAAYGLPQANQSPPEEYQGGRPPDVSLGPPQTDQADTAALAGHATSPAPQGGPENTQGVPLSQVHQSGPDVHFSAQDRQDLQALLAWWRARGQLLEEAQTPDRKLVRQTYHIEERWIEAVRRESDLTGESLAAVVNRAFARYFGGTST